MKIVKHSPKCFSAILLVLLLAAMLLPVSAFASGHADAAVSIFTVEKKLKGSKPAVKETYTFTLTPDNANCPMPAGTNGGTLRITGEGKASFGEITYTVPGDYSYTLKEDTGENTNCSYDKAEYQVKVTVTWDDNWNLVAAVWMNKAGSNVKESVASFINRYKSPNNSTTPQTGDSTNIPLCAALLITSAGILIWMIVRKLAEHGKTHNDN